MKLLLIKFNGEKKETEGKNRLEQRELTFKICQGMCSKEEEKVIQMQNQTISSSGKLQVRKLR